jgi:hypothetical protein
MAVKVEGETVPEKEPHPFTGPPAPEVGETLRALMSLMPRVIRAWKRGASGSEDDAGVMGELFRAGPLGPRHGPVIIAARWR